MFQIRHTEGRNVEFTIHEFVLTAFDDDLNSLACRGFTTLFPSVGKIAPVVLAHTQAAITPQPMPANPRSVLGMVGIASRIAHGFREALHHHRNSFSNGCLTKKRFISFALYILECETSDRRLIVVCVIHYIIVIT